MPSLTIIRGPSGFGKSTYAITHFVSKGYEHLEADMFFIKEDGSYKWNPMLLGKAHGWCQDKCRKLLMEGKNVVVSNTFTTMKELNPYLDIAKALSIEVKVYRMTKEYGNVHNVPADKVAAMKARMVDFPNEILV